MAGSPIETARAFDPTRFAELRRQRGARWGQPLFYSSETGSTNDDALAAARAGAESGSVFVADHQTRGRGRRGKTWLAAPGQNLLFSIVLRPQCAPSLVSALTLAVGLGVREALAWHVPWVRLGVKWPNDVLAGRRKLAGILCEGQFEGGRLEAVVVGIGINVYGSADQFPAELAGDVTCLEELARELGLASDANPTGGDDGAQPLGLSSGDVIASVGGSEREQFAVEGEDVALARARDSTGREAIARAPIARERVLVDVLDAIDARVSACLEGGFASLLHEFAQHDALAGQQVVVSGASLTTGTARGVDGEGRLIVESDGLLMPVVSGTVRAVRG